MDTKLIILTGIPSAGKSTSSLFLTDQLNANGFPADWIWEIRLLRVWFSEFFQPGKTTEPHRGEILLEEWRAYVNDVLASDKIHVTDSALSVIGVNMLLAHDLDHATIKEYLRQMQEIAAPLHPKVIQLVGDADTLLRRSYDERGAGWIKHISTQLEGYLYQQVRGRTGLEGVTQFYDEMQALMTEIMDEQGWDTLRLDVTDRAWHSYEDAMLRFIGCERVDIPKPDIAIENINAYLGDYFNADKTDKFTVKHNTAGKLALYNTDPPDAEEILVGELIPSSQTRWQVKSAPLWVDFGGEGDAIDYLDFIFSLNEPLRFAKMR